MKIKSFRRKMLLVQAGIFLTFTEIAQRKLGFLKCRHGLDHMSSALPFAKKPHDDPRLTQEIADIVDRAINTTSLYPAQCLTRALVLDYFLKRYGQKPEIKLGVRTLTGNLEAHAWVECQGNELNEQEIANDIYVPIDWSAANTGNTAI